MLYGVQQKISCVFETVVLEGSSAKRAWQQYNVLAGEVVKDSALKAGIAGGLPTEKLDGTCCYIAEYKGKPWLWARHDIKPNKTGLRKQKQKTKLKQLRDGAQIPLNNDGVASSLVSADGEPAGAGGISWDLEKDFKVKPAEWIPASGVKLVDGRPQPDDNGHIPGWVPIDVKSRQHCWHLSAVNLEKGFAFILQRKENQLEIVTQDLADFCGSTMELIGTNINGNPYKLGSKQAPLHLLVRHGSIPISEHLPIDRVQLAKWFADSEDGKVEGIVWHCDNGELFKLHRHHLQLPWPIDKPRLSTLPVTVRINHADEHPSLLFKMLSNLNNTTCNSLTELG